MASSWRRKETQHYLKCFLILFKIGRKEEKVENFTQPAFLRQLGLVQSLWYVLSFERISGED
jgi:hypothetical protein